MKKDLDYFRNNQANAPRWAQSKIKSDAAFVHLNYSGFICNVRENKIMITQGSVILKDPGQQYDQTVIWGSKITVFKDDNYLIVDDERVNFPWVESQELSKQSKAGNKEPSATIPSSSYVHSDNTYTVTGAQFKEKGRIASSSAELEDVTKAVYQKIMEAGRQRAPVWAQQFRMAQEKAKEASSGALSEKDKNEINQVNSLLSESEQHGFFAKTVAVSTSLTTTRSDIENPCGPKK